MGLAIKDRELKVSRALPNGAAAVTSTPINLGHGSRGDWTTNAEFLISAPALVVGDLANTSTMTYDVVTSLASDMSSPTTVIKSAIVQTGAGGVGAAAATYQFKLATDTQPYVAVKATNSASGDASDKSFTLELVF